MSTPIDPTANDFHPLEKQEDPSEFDSSEFTEIDRGDTLVRIGLTVLFAIVNGILNSVIGVTIVFELLWALVAKLPPSRQIRSLANRMVAFQYRLGRYMTYNESTVPFPFGDFPDAIEPDDFDPARRDSEGLGLPSDWLERAQVRNNGSGRDVIEDDDQAAAN